MVNVNLTIPPGLERFVQAQVEAGLYETPGEVLRDELLLLQDHHEIRQKRLERLQAELQLGIDQLDRGQYRTFTDETLGDLVAEIQAEGRRRLPELGNNGG